MKKGGSAMAIKSRRTNRMTYPPQDVLFLLPGLLGFAMCYLLPFAASLLHSFLEDGLETRFAGLQNYASILQNAYFQLAIGNTMLFLLLTLLISLTLGFLLASLLFHPGSGQAARMPAVAFVLLIPIFLPTSAIVSFWKGMMGSSSWIVQLLRPRDAQWKYFTLVTIYLWKNLGAVNLLFLTGLNGISREVFDAARVDGAGRPRMMLRIALPLLRPVLLFAIIYLAMNGLRVFRESYLLYGSFPPKELYFIQNYINNHFAKLDYGLLSAGSTIFAALVIAAFSLIWAILRKREGEAL